MTDESGEDRDYPLHDAVKNNDLDVLEELLKSGRHDNYLKDAEGQTAMDLAIQLRNCSAIELLLDHGGEPLEEIVLSEKSEKFIEKENDADWDDTILIYAVRENKKKAIVALINWDINNSNCKSNEGCSIFYYAVKQDDMSLISLLVDCFHVKWDALEEAILSKRIDIINLLLKHKYYDDSDHTECPLEYAIKYGESVAIVETLLNLRKKYFPYNYYKYGLSYNLPRMAISRAVEYNSGDTAIQIVKLLNQHGYDVNEANRRNKTALHKLAWTKCGSEFDVVCYLLYLGADVKAENVFRNTPIKQAFERCLESYYHLFLLCQPDITVTDLSDKYYPYNLWERDYDYSVEIDEDKVKLITYLLDFSNDVIGGMDHLKPEKMLFYHAKRIAAGFQSNPNLKNYREEEELEKCVKSCKDEVNKMKQTKICEDVTYYEVLRANKRRLKVLAKKPEIREALVHEKTKEFPIYAAMLDKNLLTGILFEPFPESLDDDGDIFQVSGKRLPFDVLDEIKSYLSRDDLRNWEIAKQGDSAKEMYHDIPKAVGSLFCSVLKLL